jgi:hypothetical protein
VEDRVEVVDAGRELRIKSVTRQKKTFLPKTFCPYFTSWKTTVISLQAELSEQVNLIL